MFSLSKVQTFELTDLVGRRLYITSLKDEGGEGTLTSAFDMDSGEVFVLKYKQVDKKDICYES
tara:strand:- start:5282 stop:5470 length:189 start_codon:yes stop_codon:yes gene_type:complete